MRNAIILGSGRSGTSMVTGALASAGYSMGEGLHAPRAANPKGFFETREINGINEELLAPHLATNPVLGEWQRWLGILPREARLDVPPRLAARIRQATARRPFCFKDPRFSFTLPAWRDALEDTGFVCVFRDPR